MKEVYKEFCTGCGLCSNQDLCAFENDDKGFPFPNAENKQMTEFCDVVCPMGKAGLSSFRYSIWGDYKKLYRGYSNNHFIRKKASSGGVLTAICAFLVENKMVNGVIQTTYNKKNPTETITVCSRTKEEVLECCGSRYSISSPLLHLSELIKEGEQYAFVGKPCDVIALRNFMTIDKKVSNAFKYIFSFFCAGTPSVSANEKLLRRLNCSKEECISLNYRGDGWPGYTTAIDINGEKHQLDYGTSWMEILGRDIRKSCKFCFDSIGEKADISCGDFWYLNDKNEPIFLEKDGINCIFAWNGKGAELLELLSSKSVLTIEELDEIDYLLRKVQPNHNYRRSTMLAKLVALKLMNKEMPKYSWKTLLEYCKFSDIRTLLGCFKGTIIRAWKGKI